MGQAGTKKIKRGKCETDGCDVNGVLEWFQKKWVCRLCLNPDNFMGIKPLVRTRSMLSDLEMWSIM